MSGVATLVRDLSELARMGRLDRVVGRDKELDDILRVLCRRTKSNPLLLGEPGVGKTALVEGLAQRLLEQRTPAILRDRRVVELEIGGLLAGTQFRGDLEKRVQDFIHEAKRDRAIVFIDEIHLLVVAGKGSGIDAANLLKPILARGDVPCIGATTTSEAEEMFRADPAMERRFQPIHIAEPAPETVRMILHAVRTSLEKHHGVLIEDEAIEAALTASLVGEGRRNPDRAIDLLEDVCARAQMHYATEAEPRPASPQLDAAERELAAATASLDVLRHAKARETLEELAAARSRETTALAPHKRRITVAHFTR
ncbi:MAG TPA: AAA family ATPase [Opitutaceae bacterium]|nr:AAA family ATPase [Opitutaceae bacterium]